MNVQQIIDRARRLAYVSSSQYDDTKAIEDFNVIYSDVVNQINTQVNELYFWDKFITTSVVWQNEYTIPANVSKIDKLLVDGKTYTEVDKNWLDESVASEVYYIADESVFIFPTPSTSIDIQIEGVKKAIPLLITDTEESVIVPTEFHYIISQWITSYIYQGRWMLNEKTYSVNGYNLEISNLVASLTDRNLTPSNWNLPDLSYYS